MEISTLFDFLAVKVDSIKAAELGLIRLNVINPDTKETLYVELSNGNLSNIKVDKPMEADTNLYIDKRYITGILLGKVTLKDLLANGTAKLEGDKAAFGKIASTLVKFDENFEIVPLPSAK
ncbi:Uncharacterised protein [Shewanella baltica]|nr:Uncharacterised protein [Shewanella baltica]